MNDCAAAAAADAGNEVARAITDSRQLLRPLETHRHEDGGEGGDHDPQTDGPPGPGGDLRGLERVVQLQNAAKMRQLEDLFDSRFRRRDAQRAGHALGARVRADQRAHAGAVERRHATEVYDKIPVSAAKQLLQVPFERLSRAAADDGLLR